MTPDKLPVQRQGVVLIDRDGNLSATCRTIGYVVCEGPLAQHPFKPGTVAYPMNRRAVVLMRTA